MSNNNQNIIELTTELKQSISTDIATEYKIIPKLIEDNLFSFWIDETQYSDKTKKELQIVLGKDIELTPTSPTLINRALSEHYRLHDSNETKTINTNNDFLDQIIQEAKLIKSSDIHIEIYEEKARVRMRVDGKLIEKFIIPKHEYPSLVNKVKIRANLEISEKRLPQDGRISYRKEHYNFDIRVSILPTIYGEKMVLRLLGSDASHIDLDAIGMNSFELDKYMQGIQKPHGIVLISGPTGSGKTTTLYATLKYLNQIGRNITTIEDPIEYILEGVNQVQLKESIGLTFPYALNSFLRQDPDIIMVGEIRDESTAQMAIRAALTGHLVLSTIHTNSALETITRLIDIGVPPFLLSSTLNLSVAQRLVRKLCPTCKTKQAFDSNLLPNGYALNTKIEHHFVANGCNDCHFTGYKGRQAIYEVVYIDKTLGEAIKHNNLNNNENKNIQYKKLSDTAIDLLIKGETSIDEIYAMLIE